MKFCRASCPGSGDFATTVTGLQGEISMGAMLISMSWDMGLSEMAK